jgi:hypothetical protein
MSRRDIIRNIQPNDLLVVTIREDKCTQELAERIATKVIDEIGCQVMVLPDCVTVGTKRHWWQR